MAKILIVEDDKNLSKIIEDWLTNERHTIEVADDGQDALALMQCYKYDLVVLDLMLPGMLGLDVLKDYRSKRGATPVLILTGKDKIEEKEAGLDAGADDYLTKPFNGRELCARVRALLRRPEQFSGTKLTVGNLQLEPGSLTVQRDGEDISLRPREFALLEFLMRHPNQAFTIEALLERVWKSDADISEETVRVTIKRLRTRLGDSSPITTVHGAGYMFKAR